MGRGNAYYLASKVDTAHLNVVTRLGAVPANLASTAVTSIAHEFSSLGQAEANSINAAHLGTTDLVAGNYILNFPCYYDTGPDRTAVRVDGYITSANNYIRIYTPADNATEVNQTQRHSGVWDDTKYKLVIITSGTAMYDALLVNDDHVRVEGLQISWTISSGDPRVHGISSGSVASNGVLIVKNNIELTVKQGGKTIAAPGLSSEEAKVLSRLCESNGLHLLTGSPRSHLGGIHTAITHADWAVAETATLVLDSTSEDMRLATMLSETHVAYVPVARICGDMMILENELDRLMKAPPRYLAFISGASRTADIERVLTIGVHGPQELHILIVDGDG